MNCYCTKTHFTFEKYETILRVSVESSLAVTLTDQVKIELQSTRVSTLLPKMPNTSKYTFLRGESLLLVLASCPSPIKWMRTGVKTFIIEPSMALCIAKAGVYEGKVSPSGRLFYIREIDITRQPEKDTHYWDERAILRYQEDRTNIPTHRKTKWRADLWDQMLGRNPQPRSWQRRSTSRTPAVPAI